MEHEAGRGRRAGGPTVVVGVDGTASGLRAVAWAALEARSRGARLRIVHAVPDDAAGRPRAHDVVSGARAAAAQYAPEVAVDTVIVDQAPAVALDAAVGPRDLLVVGPGPVATAVVTAAATRGRRAVVVARGIARPRGPVVLALALVRPPDHRDGEGAAVEFALAAAGRAGTRVRVVHAGRHWDAVGLRDVLRPWLDRHPGVLLRMRPGPGSPAAALVAASVGARLLVVGSHAHGWLAEALHGSVGLAAVHSAHCPVAVVPQPAPITTAAAGDR